MDAYRFKSRTKDLWALVTLIMMCISPVSSRAENVIIKRGYFHEENNQLTVSVGFREMFASRLKHRLQSGFTTTVVMRIYLYQNRSSQPISYAIRTLKVVYDLWEERYILQSKDHRAARIVRVSDQKKAIDKLTSLWHFPLVPINKIKPNNQYFLAIVAEVNPMSDELLSEVRRWLRNPYGGHRQVSGESFFGSFVSIFVNNKIRRAEKTFRLRTQPFIRKP